MCQSEKSKVQARQRSSYLFNNSFNKYLWKPCYVPTTIAGTESAGREASLLEPLPPPAEVLLHWWPKLCGASTTLPGPGYVLHRKSMWSWHASTWSRKIEPWLVLCRGRREGLCFSVFWSKEHSCYMRTSWKCNLIAPRRGLGLTICLRPQFGWELSLTGHPLRASAKGNNKVRKHKNGIKAGGSLINPHSPLCRAFMEKISRKKIQGYMKVKNKSLKGSFCGKTRISTCRNFEFMWSARKEMSFSLVCVLLFTWVNLIFKTI